MAAATVSLKDAIREAARYEGIDVLNPAEKGWRTVTAPRNLALTEANRGTFARYATPYGVDTLLRRTKDTRALQREFLIALDQPHLVRWIRAQDAFLKTLTGRDAYVILTYTRHGDKMVNGWARGTLATDIRDLMEASVRWNRIPFQYSLYDQYADYVKRGVVMPPREEWLDSATGEIRNAVVAGIVRANLDFFAQSANLGPLLRQYMADIVAVMRRSPRLIGDIVTYRGFQSEAHLKNLTYVAREFGSTSANPVSALEFAKATSVGTRQVYCCLYELTVKAGVPCLYLGSHTEFAEEYEILLPPGATYQLGREVVVKKVVYTDETLSEVLSARSMRQRAEAMVVEGIVSWRDHRKTTERRSRRRDWTREEAEVAHVPRRRKVGKGRRYKTMRVSSERLERISEALTARSESGENSSE